MKLEQVISIAIKIHEGKRAGLWYLFIYMLIIRR
jgi:hypothetical protein